MPVWSVRHTDGSQISKISSKLKQLSSPSEPWGLNRRLARPQKSQWSFVSETPSKTIILPDPHGNTAISAPAFINNSVIKCIHQERSVDKSRWKERRRHSHRFVNGRLFLSAVRYLQFALALEKTAKSRGHEDCLSIMSKMFLSVFGCQYSL